MTDSIQTYFAKKGGASQGDRSAFFYMYGKKDPKPDLTADGMLASPMKISSQ